MMVRMARASLRGRSEKGQKCSSRVFMFSSSQRKRHWSDAESLTALTLIASESNGLCQGRRTFCRARVGEPMAFKRQTTQQQHVGRIWPEAVRDCGSSAHDSTKKTLDRSNLPSSTQLGKTRESEQRQESIERVARRTSRYQDAITVLVPLLERAICCFAP